MPERTRRDEVIDGLWREPAPRADKRKRKRPRTAEPVYRCRGDAEAGGDVALGEERHG